MDSKRSNFPQIDPEWLEIVSDLGLDSRGQIPVFEVANPATGERLADVRAATERDVVAAVDAAENALASWRGSSPKQRGAVLRKWSELMTKNRERLARLLTLEQGKPVAEALSEVDNAASYLDWYAEEGKRIFGEVIPSRSDTRSFVFREPVGVCVAITPWNFPASMVTRKVAPALAAGCTVILKPSEHTPLTALAIATLGAEAGLPSGVLTVLTIATEDVGSLGKLLLQDPRVAKLSFTGSSKVGRLLSEICASTVKNVSLELGGNAPFIVLNDADLDAAVQGAIASKFRNSGQTCICANRFLVQSTVYEAFAAKLARKVQELKIGPGHLGDSQQGPLINQAAVGKVAELVDDAVSCGGRVLCGGTTSEAGPLFYQPTVLGNIDPTMRIAREEIFGPVATLIKFQSDDEAVAIANGTEYGLACYLYGQNMQRIWRFARDLQFGMIAFNTPTMTNEAAPFGGMKQSGIGREGSHFGIEEYLETKYVCLGSL